MAEPARADARRNRERLLASAAQAFATADAPVSLEAIARDAGVGIGTLYRHFPSREALVEAVHRAGLEEVCAREARLYGWTVNDRARIAALRALGVHGVATADPRLFA